MKTRADNRPIGTFPGGSSQIWMATHLRTLLTPRNPQERSLSLKVYHTMVLSRGGRRPLPFLCLLRCPNFEFVRLVTIFPSLCGIAKQEVIGKPDFYQYIFRRNTRDIIKTFHLVHSVFLTNKIVLNAAEGKGAFAKIIDIPGP